MSVRIAVDGGWVCVEQPATNIACLTAAEALRLAADLVNAAIAHNAEDGVAWAASATLEGLADMLDALPAERMPAAANGTTYPYHPATTTEGI